MKSLFLRIFLWLWVAMVILAAILVVTSPYFTKSRSRVEMWQQGAENWAREKVDIAAREIAESVSVDFRPRRERERGHGRRGFELLIFDQAGRELKGREVPQPIVDLALAVAESGAEQSVRRGGLHVVARPATDVNGKPLVLVGALHRPPRPMDLLEPEALWWRLGLLALVVGGFGATCRLAWVNQSIGVGTR
jgi:hypothetical protein